MATPVTRRDFLLGSAAAATVGSGALRASAAAVDLPAQDPGANDALDEALTVLERHGPEYAGGLSNHAPMAVEALVVLRQPAAVKPWLERYRKRLEPAPALGRVLKPSDYADALAQRDRFPDWEATFAALLKEQPWQQLVGTWQQTLLPGMVGALAHGVIRTSHAVRALSAKDTPLRRQELARALAYQACNNRPLLGPPGEGRQAPLVVLPTVPILREELRKQRSGASDQRIAEAASQPEFTRIVGNAGPDDQREPFLAELTRTTARQFVRHGAASPIMFCHAVTAVAAVQALWPCLDDNTRVLACRHGWQLVAAIQSRFANAPFAVDVIEAAAWADDCIELAVEDGDEHVIKLTAACRLAWQAAPAPEFVAAASRARELL